MRIGKRGVKTHFTKEMDDFLLNLKEYTTWNEFASAFKVRFSRFANNKVVADMSKNKLIAKLKNRDQVLKRLKKEDK